MVLRRALAFGIGITLVGAAPALAQTATGGTAPSRTQSSRAAAQPGVPHTLAEALAATYSNEPTLQAERANVRATDEGVPTALSGWRPTVVLGGTAGYGDGIDRIYSALNAQFTGDAWSKLSTERQTASGQATLTQPLYTGGQVQAGVNQAKDLVFAERAKLLAQEESSFINSVSAYIGVIENRDLLALYVNNEQVLEKQLEATNDRFRVGEITRTDVAQAEASLAGAKAQREAQEGTLATAGATYVQYIGYEPPSNLVEPQPLALPLRTEQDAAGVAAANNPNVIAAEFDDSAAKDAVDLQFGKLLPQLSLQAQAFNQQNSGTARNATNGWQAVLQLSVPLYQGGAEYSAVRKAKQAEQDQARVVAEQKRAAVQEAVNYWGTLVAATASVASTRSQIRANEIALEGVEREAIVGSRTTLDVLNAQQTLLTSRVSLVQDLAQLVTASYEVAAAIGRLTARDLHLPVPLYDDTAYYNAVKNKWAGLGDYATSQPGR
ncbi:MAG TPA: TolC family outer membrane protein [Acetobacteraceae bacterium]|jgi:outer membrane protein|nr:TolC family outer membrane protein [Acetobacteraceae bacterium]